MSDEIIKRRGRPPGAKNKPKDIVQAAANPAITQQLETPVVSVEARKRGRPAKVICTPEPVATAPVVAVIKKHKGRPPGSKNKSKEEEETPRMVAADPTYIAEKLGKTVEVEVVVKPVKTITKAVQAVVSDSDISETKIKLIDEALESDELAVFMEGITPIVASMGEAMLTRLKEVKSPSIEHTIARLLVLYFDVDTDKLKQQY